MSTLIDKQLAGHEDLALGLGKVSQSRGEIVVDVRQFELVFVFRTTEEIRSLDITRYFRVGLHTEGPLTEYYFDSTSLAQSNDTTVLKPNSIAETNPGRWLAIQLLTYYDHNDLLNRDDPDAHPQSAITGLETRLTAIETEIDDNRTDFDNHAADANAHHSQVHALYSSDHSDVLVDGSLEETQGLFQTGSQLAKNYRTAMVPYVSGQTYYPQQTVFEGGWLMTANKETTEYPVPTPVGPPSWTLPDVPVWTEYSNTSTIYSGHLYTFTKTGYFRGLRVTVPDLTPDTNYRFVIVRNPNSANPGYIVTEEPVLKENEWVILSADTVLVLEGEELLVYIDALNTGSDTTVTGGWAKAINSNDTLLDPGSGNWGTSNAETLLRINKIDLDTTDRGTELGGIVPGSTVQFVETLEPTKSITYRIQTAPVDQGTHYSWTVTVESTGVGGAPDVSDTTTMTAIVPVAQLTKFVGIDSYWNASTFPSWATITSYLQYDGISQPVQGDEAYGIDISFQELVKSDDWDVFGFTGGGTSPSTVVGTETVMVAASYVAQQPVSLGQVLQVTFGDAQSTDSFDLDTAGAFTCKKSGTYNLSVRLVFGRTGAAGVSQLYARFLIDGVQVNDSFHVILDNSRYEIPFTLDGPFEFTAGQVMTFEFVRDIDGDNSGGLEPGIPDIAGWNNAPSARLRIARTILT